LNKQQISESVLKTIRSILRFDCFWELLEH
jgi:hypothetical protein